MKTLKVLIACEFSGTVRDAFRRKGHDSWSCDFRQTEIEGQHIQGDVLQILNQGWDLMIAHPDCTYLTCSQVRWLKDQPPLKSGKLVGERRREAQRLAVEFVKLLYEAPIPKIAIENPKGMLSTLWQKPSQTIQPWQFGHPESKETNLWLKNLPPLKPTQIVEPQFIIGKKDGKKYSPIHFASNSQNDRDKIRSRTYRGWAEAMADQWS